MQVFESQSYETILSRILRRMGTNLQTREGSYCYDMAAPIAFELARAYISMGEIIDALYVDENSGKYLDMHAALLGMTRLEGTRAQAEISFSGTSGTLIPAGTAFFTAAGLEFTLDADVVLINGAGTGTLTAAEVGDEYNVDTGEISQMLRSVAGLSGFYCQESQGGTDAESDEALFDRIALRRANPATSGNEAQYIQWALECDGVGACKVTPLWNGPGTVRVMIADYERGPVDDAVTEAVKAHIEEQRPVCVDVTVLSVSAVEISVSAALTLSGSATEDEVKAAFVSELDTYLKGLAEAYFARREAGAYALYYNKVAALLMSVDGVEDYSSLSLNGGTANIEIGTTAVPVLGEVEMSCQS